MWGRGVDVCGYFGVGVRGTHPLEFFSEKIAIFGSFMDISSLNDHKNFGDRYPHPQGAMSPLKFFLAVIYRMTNFTQSTKFVAGLGFFRSISPLTLAVSHINTP